MYLRAGSFEPNSEYVKIVREINYAYSLEAYPAVDSLLKRLFKGLIIDIFRCRYSTDNSKIPLFFCLKQGEFQSFDVLLDNFNTVLDEIDPDNASLYKRSITRLRNWKKAARRDEKQMKNNLDEARPEFEAGAEELGHLLQQVKLS